MSGTKTPFWLRGGFLVSRPELHNETRPLHEQIASLQAQVAELRAALQKLQSRPNAG